MWYLNLLKLVNLQILDLPQNVTTMWFLANFVPSRCYKDMTATQPDGY